MKRNLALRQPAGSERSEFVARLQLILRHWPSADRLARAMGVSPSAFRKWLKGEAEPSRERLVALAEVAEVGIGWLARGEGPEPELSSPGQTRATNGQRQGGQAIDTTRFSHWPDAPRGAEATTDSAGYICFRHDWIRESLRVEPDAVIMEVAVGDAMAPTVGHGDLVLIDGTDTVLRQDGLYMLRIGAVRMIRRVQHHHNGGVGLITDNPAYQHDRIASEQISSLTVVGRVVWIGGTP